jgi:hypothetical protein
VKQLEQLWNSLALDGAHQIGKTEAGVRVRKSSRRPDINPCLPLKGCPPSQAAAMLKQPAQYFFPIVFFVKTIGRNLYILTVQIRALLD